LVAPRSGAMRCPLCGGKGGVPERGTWDNTCTLCDGEGECTLMQAAEWYAEKNPVDAEIDRLARAEKWVEKGWLKPRWL
jgi:hypothetical protein